MPLRLLSHHQLLHHSRPHLWKHPVFTATIPCLRIPLRYWRKRHCRRLLLSHLLVHVYSNPVLADHPLRLLQILPTRQASTTSCLCNRRDSPILSTLMVTEVERRPTRNNPKVLDLIIFIPLLSLIPQGEVRTDHHFLRILIRMTISVFHQSSHRRLKTTIGTILPCLFLLVILSRISHIHNRHINPVLPRQDLLNLFHHTIQGHRRLIIQSSTMMAILTIPTSSTRSIMEVG